MKPIDFPQSTKVLQRPSTMAESECQSLHVWNDGRQCVSCWKPTVSGRIRIAFGGNVWLGVLSGKTQPPVFVSGEKVFAKASIKARFLAFISEVKESITNVCKSVLAGFKRAIYVWICLAFIVGSCIGRILWTAIVRDLIW